MGRTSGSVPGHRACSEEEIIRCVIITCFMGCGQWFGWMVRDLEETQLENWSQEILGKRYVASPLCRGKKNVKTFVSSVNVLQRVSSAEEDSNSQVDIARLILWDTSQPSVTPVTAQWAHEQSGHDDRDGFCAWGQRHGLPVTKANLAMATAKCLIFNCRDHEQIPSIWHHSTG